MCLNGWGGKLHADLVAYIGAQRPDVLCLQEVVHSPQAQHDWLTYRDGDHILPQRANFFADVAAALPDHSATFCPAAQGVLWEDDRQIPSQWGLATFVYRSIPIIGQAQGFVHKGFSADGYGDHPRSRSAHGVRLFDLVADRAVSITHMHGLRDLRGKMDTPDRAAQARRLLALSDQISEQGDTRVICGDFNVEPDSETQRILGDAGFTDLVTSRGHRLCHGGPIISPEHALALARICGVQGFVAGSTLDRIPLEQTLNEVTRGFTAIPSLSRVRSTAGDPHVGLVGSSQAMQHIRNGIEELAFVDIPVLITGETGTGKSLAAQCIHNMGPAASRAPVLVDCAALDAEEGGAHLLGRAAGARAGTASHRGALEQAAKCTIIFEEINALLPEHQGKILKFVDEGIVQRIGDHTVRDVSARVVSTTTADRFALADGAGLRSDLFHRVSGHIISIPPLRDRVDDIPELAFHLARNIVGGEPPKFSNAALRRLLEYSWPGNVRELKYAVMRALRQRNGSTIGLKAVAFLRQSPIAYEGPNLNTLPDGTPSERELITSALSRNGFRRAETALELGITTRTLYNKIKKLGLQV